ASEAQPVLVDRQLQSCKLSIDVHVPAGNRIEAVAPERLVKSIADVQALDVTVAGPAQIIGANGVRLGNSVRYYHAPDRSRTHQETVGVKVNRGIVLVGKKAEFRGVALGKKVLNVNVGNLYLLFTRLEGIETAVGVLLQHVEVGEVVVDAVRTQVPEYSHSRLLIREDEAAEVAGELLNSGTDRHEVKVRTQVVEFQFHEPLLQTHMRVEPVGARLNVDVDDAAFLGLE